MILFEVVEKFGKRIRTTKSYWQFIISAKHPAMNGKENLVKLALANPDEIRRSKRDLSIYLYYKKMNEHFVSVVCKHLNGDGYIITTYVTDKIKEGVPIWKKQ